MAENDKLKESTISFLKKMIDKRIRDFDDIKAMSTNHDRIYFDINSCNNLDALKSQCGLTREEIKNIVKSKLSDCASKVSDDFKYISLVEYHTLYDDGVVHTCIFSKDKLELVKGDADWVPLIENKFIPLYTEYWS